MAVLPMVEILVCFQGERFEGKGWTQKAATALGSFHNELSEET